VLRSDSIPNCKLYAVCSEPQTEANLAMVEWNLSNFASVVGDPENVVALHFRNNDKYLPRLHITDCSKTLTEALDPCLTVKRYPHGAVQPAFLFFIGNKPAARWAVYPTVGNLQGALSRPDPAEVWTHVKECKRLSDEGKDFEVSSGEEFHMTITCGQACRQTCCAIL
jgi:hypothetical protein